jgi:hypothetical protein
LRKESYYLIKNLENHRQYVLPIDEKAVADLAFLNYLCNRRNYNSKYDITGLLTRRTHMIDSNKSASFNKELDYLARIRLLHEAQIDTTNLSKEELETRLNSIPDTKVVEKIEQIRKELAGRHLSIDDRHGELESFLASLGLNQSEAKSFILQLRNTFKVTSVEELRHLNREQLQSAYYALENPTVSFDSLFNKITAFINTFKH